MSCGQQVKWVEDDCNLPAGALRLDISKACCGQTYVMYHGTAKTNVQSILCSGFHQSADGMLGRGVYLSRDLIKASRYPSYLAESERVVFRVLVRVGRVKAIKYQGHPYQKTWHDFGYDTAWVPPNCGMVPSGLEEDCVWDPSRITVIDVIKPLPQ